MVPVLYLIYRDTAASLTAQTIVAHATSLGVGFVTSLLGMWRYHRSGAIEWRPALVYGIPGVLSAFAAARLVTGMTEAAWLRTAFGGFLLVTATDMARRALALRRHGPPAVAGGPAGAGVPGWRLTLLALVGVAGGLLSAALGIGGGLVAVPALLYIGRLPVRDVVPTSLVAVVLATLAGAAGYVTARPAPEVSGWMAGFVDLRMMLPLALGAAVTVPLGVRINRASRPETLLWTFAVLLGLIGLRLVLRGAGG